jgi:hypothetical protein
MKHTEKAFETGSTGGAQRLAALLTPPFSLPFPMLSTELQPAQD